MSLDDLLKTEDEIPRPDEFVEETDIVQAVHAPESEEVNDGLS